MSARHWATRLHLPTLGAVALILAAWAALSWRYGAYEAFLAGKLQDYEYPAAKIEEALRGVPKVKV